MATCGAWRKTEGAPTMRSIFQRNSFSFPFGEPNAKWIEKCNPGFGIKGLKQTNTGRDFGSLCYLWFLHISLL